MFIAADPDNVVRMYTIHGSVHHALQYFLRMHVNDPGVSCVRPKTATVNVVGPVRTADVDPAVLAALAKSQCNADALESILAAEAAAFQAQAAAAEAAALGPGCALAQKSRPQAAGGVPPPQMVLGGAQSLQAQRQSFPAPAGRLKVKGMAQPLWIPPRVTAVRILRHETKWEVDCDVYVGPPVVLRQRDGRGNACTRPMMCAKAALAPPGDRALLCTEAGRAQYASAARAALQRNHCDLLSFLANKTIGCWCIHSATCHAHILAAVANQLLAAPAPAPPPQQPVTTSPPPPLPPQPTVRVRKHRRHRG
jgi:hypothetical protein